MKFLRLLLLSLLLAIPALVLAAVPAKASWEIEQLMSMLGRSGCEFERNGSWYPAQKAEDHLRRKYEWLRKHDLVDSTEQFIVRAGSVSKVSGRVYMVRCPGQPVVTSGNWLRARLVELRRGTPHPH